MQTTTIPPIRKTKKEKRVGRQEEHQEGEYSPSFKSQNFKLKKVSPLTDNQQRTFDCFEEGSHLFLHGMAGTGKTFIALYLALRDLTKGECRENKIVLIRSVVPTRDMGFLPGSVKEKQKPFEVPYSAICNELYGRGDAYEVLKQKSAIEFMPTSFIRGTTINNAFIIVDEVQNMNDMELHSVMTRVGKHCTIVFCGDMNQDDLTSERKKEYSGIIDFMSIIKNMRSFDFIQFTVDDIVRSELVKEYLIQRYKLGF